MFRNGSRISAHDAVNKTGNSLDVQMIALTGVIEGVQVGDTFTLMVENETAGGNTINVNECNYNMIAVSGEKGDSGSSGTSGTSGTTGTSGTSGVSGADGSSGTSGTAGTSGITSTSGTSGTSGISVAGSSGTSGVSGSSGTSGVSGSSGTSGTSGVSGSSGTSGTSGVSGSSGTSGTSGVSGSSGTSGTSGVSGSSGTSGTSGTAGTSGTSGTTLVSTGDIIYKINGGGSAITTGQKGYFPIDFACTINQWTLVADVAGSAVINLWKANLAIPTSAGNMVSTSGGGTAGIILSGSQYSTGGASGWRMTAVSAGDIIGYNVLSNGTCGIISVGLKIT
jgi:hypothetical protein